jgi:hypothetical protein
MRTAVWTFIQPRPTSITPSDKIARLVSELAKAPLVWNEDWAPKFSAKKTDILFIVNGVFAFCKNLPAVAPAIRKAKRVIWIQNDYAIIPPKSASKGESPFRAAFRERAEAGLPEMEFWTTVEESIQSKQDRYVNWNAMAYGPLKKAQKPRVASPENLIYYGYFRDYRKDSFDKYFAKGKSWVNVASPSKDFPKLYPKLKIIEPIKGDDWLMQLRKNFGVGLYIEDKRQHVEYHSPATRFYEMLSAGLPIAFDIDCHRTFKKYKKFSGYDFSVAECLVDGRAELKRFIKHRDHFAKVQRAWHHDFANDLRIKVKKLMKEVL